MHTAEEFQRGRVNLPVLQYGGGSADRAQRETVLTGRFHTSAGVPLSVTAGLMALSALVPDGDTGAVHLAVALGRRVIMVMESASPGQAFLFEHPEWAVTRPSGNPITTLPIDTVINACEQAMGEFEARRA